MRNAVQGLVMALVLVAITGVRMQAEQAATTAPGPATGDKVAQGAHLVHVGGCNDCHTPLKMGPNGPEPDMTRMLSGHPQELVMPPAPKLPDGPWNTTVSATLTAWSGPWGVSFTQNLTSDPETGLGRWTEAEFVGALQTGRHQGRGRQILPPMPWKVYSTLPEEDLRMIWAYLQTVPPIRNKVPDPIAPPAPPAPPAK